MTNDHTDTSSAKKISKKGPKSAPRVAAFRTLDAILADGTPLDDAISKARKSLKDPRDKALHRQLVMTVLRHHGELSELLASFLDHEPKGRAKAVLSVLKVGMAQVLFLDIPSYAAVSTSVDLVRRVGFSGHAKMVNAVMRRTVSEGESRLKQMDTVRVNTPEWMIAAWSDAFGGETARSIAESSLTEPALDLTVKSNPEHWANVLGGAKLPTGSLRLRQSGAVETLAGFSDGEWWVQDAAATIPATLMGNVEGLRIADLCAAPGGKTAQLAALGANVVSVDRSAERMKRLKENLKRLSLSAETIIADAAEWQPEELFDAVLVDAPCTATGTLRRHPDILLAKQAGDVPAMAHIQSKILDNALNLLKPGGMLVYCTCSLQPEEGEVQAREFASRHDIVSLLPIRPDEVSGLSEILTPEGYVRTLPCQLAEYGGWDGFFVARFRA